ncbi:MAG TPA: pyridine nucleotide-disulfide oxidoreductase, partial [Achromobacter sp.]|nr:pyridine nucleotide-disulfide oxidoreductase [Achromobacter sp.]
MPQAPSAAQASADFDVVVVGGGAAGIGVTASLLRRRPDLRIAVIEPSDKHYYQPAWTLVGGGAFDVKKTVRPTRSVMPSRATWLHAAAAGFEPQANRIRLADG